MNEIIQMTETTWRIEDGSPIPTRMVTIFPEMKLLDVFICTRWKKVIIDFVANRERFFR